MPALYDKADVRFQYPENWRLDEQLSRPREITLHRPDGGYWSLSIYDERVAPEQLVSEVVQTMAKEYDSLETHDVTQSIAGIDVTGCNMDFFYLDFVVSAQVRAFPFGERTMLVMAQAESREFDENELVFQAITHSLISESDHADS